MDGQDLIGDQRRSSAAEVLIRKGGPDDKYICGLINFEVRLYVFGSGFQCIPLYSIKCVPESFNVKSGANDFNSRISESEG